METKVNELRQSKKKDLNIAIVEDDPFYRSLLVHQLSKNDNYSVSAFNCGEELMRKMPRNNVDVVILDYKLDDVCNAKLTGLDVLKELKEANPNISIIMLSGQDNIEISANCIKSGACDYIVKSKNAFQRLSQDINEIVLERYHRKQIVEMVLVFVSFIVFVAASSFLSNSMPEMATLYISGLFLLSMGSFMFYHYAS